MVTVTTMYSEAITTYQEAAIYSADPKELTRMLYDGAIDAVRAARTAFDDGDVLERGRKVTKAINIIDELASSLDFTSSPAISRKLVTLYAYLREQLMKAHTKRTRTEYDEAERILRDMLEAWRGVCAQLGAPTDEEPEGHFAYPADTETTRSWSL